MVTQKKNDICSHISSFKKVLTKMILIRLCINSATIEFFDSDGPRSWIQYELWQSMKKNWYKYWKNIAIAIKSFCSNAMRVVRLGYQIVHIVCLSLSSFLRKCQRLWLFTWLFLHTFETSQSFFLVYCMKVEELYVARKKVGFMEQA